MLWEPERHESVSGASWDPDRAREAIRSIAAEAEHSYDSDTLWPEHPLDKIGLRSPHTSIAFGAAGMAWALEQLRARGAVELETDWASEADVFVDIYRHSPETKEPVPSLMIGELGPRMVANDDHDRIYELIASNIENPALENLWGAPGTMVPALILYERTGKERWRQLYLRNVDHLIATWQHHPGDDAWLWTQHLYGEVVELIGAGHGFAGNAFALLRGLDLLSAEQLELTISRAGHTLVQTARREGGLANWPQHVGDGRRGRNSWLMQWCHGAPGMIVSLDRLPADEEVDQVLIEGGEAVWRAGPLKKGPGICHGTAGNGYAFLSLAARTGDVMWLERARSFGMHAIEQVERARQTHGMGRYCLWTGDVGTAMYLLDCVDGAGRMPVIDYL